MLTSSPKGVSSTKLAQDLGITQKSAWRLGHRIRRGWTTLPHKMEVKLEVDEAFFGGLRKNMRMSKCKCQGKTSGYAGKEAVIGNRERTIGRVYARHEPDVRRKTIHRFLDDTAYRNAMIFTDQNFSYEAIPFLHASVNHNRGQYVDGNVSTNSIESFWGILKRA